jgi:hypothetical protein
MLPPPLDLGFPGNTEGLDLEKEATLQHINSAWGVSSRPPGTIVLCTFLLCPLPIMCLCAAPPVPSKRGKGIL